MDLHFSGEFLNRFNLGATMKLITIRSQIIEVADKWDAQYPTPNSKSKAVSEKLRAMDPATATAADVESIIGNCSWARPRECDECGLSFDVVIEVGDDTDYESNTVRLCVGCLYRALELADGIKRV